MYTKSFVATTVTDKYKEEYKLFISQTLEEKLQWLISKKYDLDESIESIEIKSFAFLGQVIVVSDDNGYQYTLSYSEL